MLEEKRLQTGAGSAVIHFPEEVFPTDGLCGVHDDPYVRVLVLECGERVAIAAFELVGLAGKELELVRNIVAEHASVDVDHVWIHVTHAISTPHVPRVPQPGRPLPPGQKPDPDAPKKAEAFMKTVTQAAAKAAASAVASLRPALLGIGRGTCNINTNRDVETSAGYWIGFNPEGFSNKTATILRFEDETGAAIANVISYGLKPCAIDNSEMEQGTRLVSSDIPGRVCLHLEQEYRAPCLFLMAAAGDQVPKEQAVVECVSLDGTMEKVDAGVEKGLEIVARLAAKMENDMRDIISNTCCTQGNAAIKTAAASLRWDTKGRMKMRPCREFEFKAEGQTDVAAEIITIGDVALVALKPELNAITEFQLQAASPYQHTLIASMTNGGQKYMPDAESYKKLTWEAQSSQLMPGAAEAWVNMTVGVLKQVKGEM